MALVEPPGKNVVQILIGSSSDEEIVRSSKMSDTLRDIGIEVRGAAYSAHRNADELTVFVREHCADVDVFIAVAGMAAALPGAIAAITRASKLVIAVPLDEDGIDSCLYMPPGVPVALAGVGKAGLKNAALIAAQVLGIGDLETRNQLVVYISRNTKPPKDNIQL